VLTLYWDSLYNLLMVLPFMSAVISNSYLENSCHSTMSFLYFVYVISKPSDDTDSCKLHHSTSMDIFMQLAKE